MGAANDKESNDGEPISQYPFPCCAECVICSCPPSNKSEESAAEYRKKRIDKHLNKSGSFRVVSRNFNRVPDSRLKEMCFEFLQVEATTPKSESTPLTRPHSLDGKSTTPLLTPPKPPMVRPSLSFSGKLPDDWSPEQQRRLQWAVEEVSSRSNIRPPGFRAMQLVQAARERNKRELEGHYNLRLPQFPLVPLSIRYWLGRR